MEYRDQTLAMRALSWREKISYGVADMGFNFYWANIATFLMIFYTDVFGISAAAAGSMLFVIKIINAFTDPMIGAAADRTHTRFGKFRPYLIWMALPLAGAGGLTYTTPDLNQNGKLMWAYGTYLFMMVCYTCVNIPYNALSGVMSSDPQERTTINGLRFIFAFGGSMVVTAATPFLVKGLGGGNERLGWQLTMVFWGLAASGLFAVTFFNTRERIAPPPAQKTQAASSNAPVLIRGETGTGKELLARAIHFNSSRSNNPLVTINCGAIPKDLLESELFGHRRGAFTGAIADKKGRIELADGGTLFLDEIAELSTDLQVKLLRLIQEGEIEKIGSEVKAKVDVRIIAASHRDLQAMIEDGTFREY